MPSKPATNLLQWHEGNTIFFVVLVHAHIPLFCSTQVQKNESWGSISPSVPCAARILSGKNITHAQCATAQLGISHVPWLIWLAACCDVNVEAPNPLGTVVPFWGQTT